MKKLLIATGVVLAMQAGIASSAEARSSFGLSINSGPSYYAPAPVYYAPQPVYYAPQPVYYQPAPVYYQPTYYSQPGYSFYYNNRDRGRHWDRGRGHGRGHGHWN